MMENRGDQISGTAYGFLILAWITILLRCYCRMAVVKCFGSDDWLAVFATVFYTVYCSFSIEATSYGSGMPTANIPVGDLTKGLMYWWLCEPVYIISGLLIKLSIGVFLLRICVAPVQKTIIYITEAVMAAMSIGYFFVFIFQCRPSSYFWTRYGTGSGTCLDTSVVVNVAYGYTSVCCLVDWILGVLPVFLVWNLQMNSKTKVSVAMILALGAVASTATIVRIPYLSGLSNVENFLYATTDVAIWSTVEVGIAISASAIATLRPLFRSLLSVTNLSSNSGARTGNRWPTGASRAGYLRSGGQDEIGLGLRAGNDKTVGVTTTVGAGSADEDDDEEFHRSGGRKGSNARDWNRNNRTGYADGGSDNSEWAITKTMEIHTNTRDIV